MRHLVLSILLGLLLAFPVRADTAENEENAAVRALIAGQITAFRADDVMRAFGFASPSIQNKFGTAETFGRMVREGYPMVWRPSEVVFLEARRIGGKLWQEVFLRDADGRGWIAEYEIVELDGVLRINGVRIREAPEQSV